MDQDKGRKRRRNRHRPVVIHQCSGPRHHRHHRARHGSGGDLLGAVATFAGAAVFFTGCVAYSGVIMTCVGVFALGSFAVSALSRK